MKKQKSLREIKNMKKKEKMNFLVHINGLLHDRDDELKIYTTCKEGFEIGEWVVHGRGRVVFHAECAYNQLTDALPKLKRVMRKKAVDML